MLKAFRRLAVAAALATVSASVAVGQTPMVPSTRDFVTAAAESDTFEILEARTAVTQTHDPRVRAFAQEMIRAHTRTSQTLAQAAMRAGMDTLPKGLSGEQQKLLGALQSQRGPEFDRTYFKQQALAHQEALVVQQAYAAQGANADLRQAAQAAVPIIRRHLAMASHMRVEFKAP